MFEPMFFAVILWLLSVLVRKTNTGALAKWGARLLAVSAALSVGTAFFINWAAPKVTLPPPTGEYSVAMSHWVVNTGRAELYTQNPSDERKLHVKVWYPTADLSGVDFVHYKPKPKKALYASPGMADVHAGKISSFGPLSFLGPHLTEMARTSELAAYAGAAPLKTAEKFPVLLFSPGHHAHLDFFSTTMQDVASHGYIVVGVNHSYEVDKSILPTGEILQRTDVALQDTMALSVEDFRDYEKQLTAHYEVIERVGAKDEDQFAQAYNDIINVPQDLTQDLPIRVADLLSVINFIETTVSGTESTALLESMDLTRVGAFGMSFGGPTSAEFCRAYGKCVAVANIDGKNWGDMLHAPLDVPMMWVNGAYTAGERFDVPYTLKHWKANAYRVLVPGALHQAFTDAPFLSPLVELMVLEYPHNIAPSGHSIDIMRTTNAALVALFDRYAKGKPLQLKQIEEMLDGVKVEQYIH
ncbi:MAG: hypothetical protein JKY57_04780 [Kordiimonadaceae bacterium]|nr:hypothetical protein [Kordiimonadaceae bacterium]